VPQYRQTWSELLSHEWRHVVRDGAPGVPRYSAPPERLLTATAARPCRPTTRRVYKSCGRSSTAGKRFSSIVSASPC